MTTACLQMPMTFCFFSAFFPDPDFTYLGGILNPIPGLVYYLFFLSPCLTGLLPPWPGPSAPSRLPVRALGGRRDRALQSGGAGGQDEARPGGGLHLDHPGHPESQGAAGCRVASERTGRRDVHDALILLYADTYWLYKPSYNFLKFILSHN